MGIIYEAIKDAPGVDPDLKILYREAVNGRDKAIKKRINNRITNFRRTLRSVYTFLFILVPRSLTLLPWHCLIVLYACFRPHPKVQQIDMLHASDYANMNLQQMNKTLNQNKKNDKSVSDQMQYVLVIMFYMLSVKRFP